MAIFSHSRINAFENCPLQFKYRYLDHIKSEQESIEAFMGSRVHEALEKLYKDLQLSKKNNLDDLLSLYQQNWEKNWHDQIVIVKKGYTPENYRLTGERCITNYYKKYAPFTEGITLGLEEKITINLAGGKYNLQGFVDRLVKKDEGHYEIHDYKTSGHIPVQTDLDSDRQLALYQIAIEERWPDAKKVELVWHYLVFDAEMRSFRSREQLEILKKDVIRQIQKIEAAESFPPNESALCSWCVYQYLCPAKKHLSQTEEMPAEKFQQDDGVVLVNKYAKLKEQEKMLTEQLEELKKSIMAYAQQENVTVIRGSDFKIRIQSQTRSKFLDDGTLKQLLTENKLWSEVSKIDDKLLEGLLNSDKLKSELKAHLKKFQETNIISFPRVYPLKETEK